MLYNLINFIVSFLLGAGIFYAGMRYGVKNFLIGFEANTGRHIETEKKKTKRVSKKESEEVRRRNAIMANIDAFDGTPFGQQEIK